MNFDTYGSLPLVVVQHVCYQMFAIKCLLFRYHVLQKEQSSRNPCICSRLSLNCFHLATPTDSRIILTSMKYL